MATEIGTAYATIAPKLSDDFDSKIAKGVDKASKAGGASGGKSFGSSFSIAAGNLMSDAMGKVIGSIASHIGSAISRVDALNQFPKVMANIGFSADDASKSMGKLSDGIQGLPTTLDDIVGNAQMLAISIGDLDMATDVTIALNDAFLMFGASSDDVTAAITQLNQMITTGTYDMQSWNSINSRAPGLLDKVAKSMLGDKANAQQLREELNNGSLSSKDLLSQFVALDKQGSGEMAAFSQGVKSATGGIRTSMSRVDSAITRNVANLVQLIATETNFSGACDVAVRAINNVGSIVSGFLTSAFANIKPYVDRFTDAVGSLITKMSPGLQTVINLIGTVIGSVLIGAIQFAVDAFTQVVNAVNYVIDAFSWLWDAVKWVAGVFWDNIGSFGDAMWSAYDGVVGAVDAIWDYFGWIKDLASSAWGWGHDIVTGIADGIKAGISWVTDAVSGVASKIRSFLHFSEPDVGPLRDFHTYMPDMMKGMAKDIKDNKGLVESQIDDLAGMMSGNLSMSAGIDGSGIGSAPKKIVINNLTVNAADVLTERKFESMLRGAAMQYA